ncbi:hypothetical protein [Indioceanicola profundi]|uniref:hypothetical protein n=1 Tax=Indioceanicola profundi TaxID=2220096 RepID=UPI0013C4649B|nr:hypothetical protein [Indioceanicola profundi]
MSIYSVQHIGPEQPWGRPVLRSYCTTDIADARKVHRDWSGGAAAEDEVRLIEEEM